MPLRFRNLSAEVAALGLALVASACGKGATDAPIGITCPGAQIVCGETCVDATRDPSSCGACGLPCTAMQTCQAGVCQCAAGLLDCNGRCEASCSSAVTTPALVTSAPGAYWKTDGELTEVTSGDADVTIDDAATLQTWEGFGGAFNEIGWNVLSMLSQADRDAAIELLYGADGARFAFGRIPIGASDYALDRYTLDETADDASLASFSIDRDRTKLIPYMKAAQAVKGNIRFWASPWTPPTWMKKGPFSKGKETSPFDGGTIKTDGATLTAFARYLVEFVRAYAREGITIEAVSPQNEPNYAGTYPTCTWSPATYTAFIGEYLGPAIADAGLTTKIVLGTLNGSGSDRSIFGSVMADATARNYIKVFGYQWGMRDSVAGAKRYHLPVWQTEHQCGNYPWSSPFDAKSAPNDQAYAVESWGLIRNWIKAGVTAYSAWNMVLDGVGVGIDTSRVWPQNALLTVDPSARTLTVTPAYYVFRHVSRFAAPGAKVVATRGGDALGFVNPDGGIVAVMYNAGAAKTAIVAIAGKKLRLALPGNGWATVVSR